MSTIRQLIIASLLLTASVLTQARTCTITSDTTPPPVNAGATHTFTASCPSPTWSVTGAGSIDPVTGIYSAPAQVTVRDYARGWQLLPLSSVYKLPVNTLPVNSNSAYWLQRVADGGPTNPYYYHTLKFKGTIGNPLYYDNIVNNSTPTQLTHGLNGAISAWDNIPYPTPLPPNVMSQGGYSMDVQEIVDNHLGTINWQTGEQTELYQFYLDFKTFSIVPGNPTLINYTTNTIRTIPNPERIYIEGITGSCSIINTGTSSSDSGILATVVSQTPGVGGQLSVPFNTTGFNCTLGAPLVEAKPNGCHTCNTGGGVKWHNNSNGLFAANGAGGSPLSALSIHSQEWWNVTQQGILDPACNCVTLGHEILTTIGTWYGSPRELWPSVTGNLVVPTPNIILTGGTTGTTTTLAVSATNCGGVSCLTSFDPCAGWTYTTGCTFKIVIGNLSPFRGTWAAANGPWTATAVDATHFTIPLNSTTFPAFPANQGYYIYDWLPTGARVRLNPSFNVASFCTGDLTTKCPYEKTILNTLQVYGMFINDFTLPNGNWQLGYDTTEFFPDILFSAATNINTNSALQNIESLLQVVDESGQQINILPPYTDPTNQLGLTAYNRVTVTASSSGYTPASIDVQLQGTAVGVDYERISVASGNTSQIHSWVSGNANTAVTYTMAPPVAGASVSSGGLITAPASLSAVAKTTITVTSVADTTAKIYMDVYFIPTSPDGNIRLAMGLQQTSYTDTRGNKWWGQYITRSQFSQYENAPGLNFTDLCGTWDQHSSSWSGTIDAQLYAQSTCNGNQGQDQILTIVVPNGTYTLTDYGEPGYGTTHSGQNVFDVEVQGTVIDSFLDGFTLAGSLYHGYTRTYTATVTNGILQFTYRARQASVEGISESSLLISPAGSPAGGCPLVHNAVLNNVTVNCPGH